MIQPDIITGAEQLSLVVSLTVEQSVRSCDSSPLISLHSDHEECISSPVSHNIMGDDELTQYS